MNEAIPYCETAFGFDYGAASVTRCFSDRTKGWVVLAVDTPRDNIQVYVTKTGKIRVFREIRVFRGGNELLEQKR